MHPWLLLLPPLLPFSFLSLISPALEFSLSLSSLPHSLSLAKAYSYGKQGTANYGDSDEDGVFLPPPPPSLAKAYSYGKQGTANYDDSDEDGATGYSYYSTSYGDEVSPAISSSNEEEESEPEELEESLENCSVNDSTAQCV